jgi:hypothetical protein
MRITVSFAWNETEGEGRISKADKRRLLELAKTDWITAADFTQDGMYDAENLYNEVMATARANAKYPGV